MRSPFVYLPGDRLSEAELSAACLDGHLIALGEGFVPADIVETRALRGASIARLLGENLAATHLTAAWVHGALDEPPARHTVQRAVERRLHHVIDRRLAYRDGCVDGGDLQHIGGALVTSPARTLADLARAQDDAYAPPIVAWAERYPAHLDDALEWFENRPRLPHRRQSMARLRELRTT